MILNNLDVREDIYAVFNPQQSSMGNDTLTLASESIMKHLQNIFCIHMDKHVAAMYRVIT